jgi:predicted Holliday junction resolvase-like endonuclease
MLIILRSLFSDLAIVLLLLLIFVMLYVISEELGELIRRAGHIARKLSHLHDLTEEWRKDADTEQPNKYMEEQRRRREERDLE